MPSVQVNLRTRPAAREGSVGGLVPRVLDGLGRHRGHLHGLGRFHIARLLHAQGMSGSTGRSTGRFYGSIGTLLVIAALSVVLLIRSLG